MRADVIVVDPPRKGCDEPVLQAMAKMAPDRIVYVSCNPVSLARDLAILQGLGYCTVEVQPVAGHHDVYQIDKDGKPAYDN